MQQMFDTAERLKALREHKKELTDLTKANNEAIDVAEQALAELTIQTETQSFNRAGTMFYLQNKLHANAAPERRDELFDVLRQEGYGDLIYETVNANSLAAFAREQMEENDDALPGWLVGLVNVYEKSTVGIRKGAR